MSEVALRLTVLGSGSCELLAGRSSPAYLVEAGATSTLLDLGQGALRRLLDSGRDPSAIGWVALSHHHLDHLADLLPLLFALNYDPVLAAKGRLTLVADRAVGKVVDGLRGLFGEWVEPPPERLEERYLSPGEATTLGEVRLTCARAAHIASSLAFRLEREGASLVYLGDSAASVEVEELARGADLLVAHAAGTDADPKPGHLHPSAAGGLAARAVVGALLLSHLYRVVDPEQAVASAASRFAGPVWAAHDGMAVEVGAGGARLVGD